MRTVYYLVEAPAPILVSAEVLGTSWPVAGLPSAAQLLLPAAPAQLDDELWQPLVAPQVDPRVASVLLPEQEGGPGWGQPAARYAGGGALISAQVSYALLETTCDYEMPDATREFSQSTTLRFATWFRCLMDWLEVMARLDLAPAQAMRRPGELFLRNLPVAISHDDDRVGWFASTQGPVVEATLYDPANFATFSRAVDAASLSSPPPLEHLMLRDADAARRRHDPRRAIVDGASAVEIALAAAIRRTLTHSTTEGVDRLLRGLNGIVQLFDLYEAVRPGLAVKRGDLVNSLAGPRNAAVHEGRTPSDQQLRHGLRLAREVVEALVPLT